MSYQSERELEENLIKKLTDKGYERVKIQTEKTLYENLKNTLSILNKENLENKSLTDKEFKRILTHLEGKTVFQSAKILRDKYILEREDKEKVYIKFFDQKNLSNNIFQVTNQLTINKETKSRYDVTILINGLPLVQIELKRRGVNLKDAFIQINKYKKTSYKDLFRYVQIFIISSGVDTKYFSNTDKEFLFNQTFFFTDEKNKRISNLNDFTDTFLDKMFLSEIISKYVVINESDKNLMVMRPYQIYAVKEILNRAKYTKNNGFIWHTTGSGKTLTSFKVSQILSNEKEIKKVFFLVDRKDLDSQTLEEFNKFEQGSVDTTDKTDTLVNQINDINRPLIVTTIQKMANAIKNDKYKHIMDLYKDEKVIFIIDECHRSQFGKMHLTINKFFKNAQYFGFTGTPRFAENKSAEGKTTIDLFEKCLHSYLIKDAISDNNVLGFSVEYINTFDEGFITENEKISKIDKDEVFKSSERINLITENILKIHSKKTKNKRYTAIFAVSDKEMLIKYYNSFKTKNHDLKIAGIFSLDNSDEGDVENASNSLNEIIKDYNKMFDTNFSTDTYSGYFKDLSKKVKNAQIDILIVVNMFLTGFDSKFLNTLYVDKNLKYHELLQAYSRTNRIEKDTKPYGNIVCYRNLKQNTDDAIRLFSNTNNTDTVLMKSYDYYLDLWNDEINNLLSISKTPSEVDNLESEKDKEKFIISFRNLTKILNKLNTFIQFEFDKEVLKIDEQTYEDYKGKYFTIYESVKKEETEKTSILSDIDFCIELIHTDKINVDYILNLIRNIDISDNESKIRDVKHILKELDKSDNKNLRLKSDLIREFLNEVVLKKDIKDINKSYLEFENIKKDEEIYDFSSKIGLEKEKIKDYLSEYEFYGIIPKKQIIDEITITLKPKFSEKLKLRNNVISFIINHVDKFSY